MRNAIPASLFAAAAPALGVQRDPLLFIKLWLLLSAWCCAAGWFLSACHQLNVRGYLISAAVSLLGLALWRARVGGWTTIVSEIRAAAHRLRCRLRRPLPLAFALLAVLALFSGSCYEPCNPDATVYRLPRVLHWLSQEQWHWIHTGDGRQNFYGTASEWMYAPLLLFTGSDRLLFLPSLISFLLLPGLLFLTLRGLAVSSRVSWAWMWVLTAAWSFALQAGSAANDLFGAIYAAAALALALRALRRQDCTDWWWSLLAAALMTNAKQTNLPLLLPWFIAAAAGWRLPAARPWSTGVIAGAAVAVSCAFHTFMNLRLTGRWLGWTEGTPIMPESVWIGVIGNTFTLTVRNLIPPIFPWAPAWNQHMEDFLATPLGAHFRTFEFFGTVPRAVAEESAGFGLFPVLFLAASCLAAAWAQRRFALAIPRRDALPRWILWSGAFVLLVYLAKMGGCQNARTLTPYHPLLLAGLLAGAGHNWLTRQRAWTRLALVLMLSTAALLVLSRQRPLWPAQTTIQWAAKRWPQSRFLGLVVRSYGYSGGLLEVAAQVREALPPDEKTVGLAAFFPIESALWKPYGSRRVLQVRKDDTPEFLRSQNIRTVIISDYAILESPEGSLEKWLRRWHARIEKTIPARLAPEGPPMHYYVVRIQNS